ncbi:TPA: TetR/AcrR family transcriptional regulator [Pseudomonas aeruginosa]|uniref:TetR/AcrR family transcriptional regulator n=3 Tax=Pseudomonas aeruginosa TaxID=287 RepID=UPI0009367CEF|nr:TetR/AcrR family transcriptional regulator [Pseudomonas aeruginosa]EKJ8518161.1 TetR/AcrR family transcriptional regulator [Pseudomonas aeruginosa]ELP0276290.1 TetR/AcrR family transcriptional regulator [Pseudomonas aeruginosa]MBG4807679.1 TetR/AcrR family transcriptional regulator [Pseudomonas aeruginosa]MBG5029220.1 TetR/AcrR family transcriptional regulator [Pseudomonas aeruginosa]MBI7447135.1 TetR/AcrR family transcriptional regulator [Pseudomonas aeruginosa]
MKKEQQGKKRGGGRPLSFDRNQALEAAMRVFWSRGFEASSVNMLVEAMGVTPPSLYTAFGDKQSLYAEALDHYLRHPSMDAHRLLTAASTARGAVELLLQAAILRQTKRGQPQGCMLMGAMVNSPPVSDIDQKIIRARADFEDSLRIRLDRAVQDLELPPDTDTHALAGYYLAMLQGISAQARDGANSEKLEGIIRIAMRAWP